MAKIGRAMDIQQAKISSDPKATLNFGVKQVSTQLSEHLQNAQPSSSDAIAPTELSSRITRSAAQVMKDLNYRITRVNPTAVVKADSQEQAKMKSDDEQKHKVELDEDSFKIQQGIFHRNKKKLEADKRHKIVKCILHRDHDPSGCLVDIVKVRHEHTPYGLSEKEWRCYLLYLMNIDHKHVTLPQVYRKLVMELEP